MFGMKVILRMQMIGSQRESPGFVHVFEKRTLRKSVRAIYWVSAERSRILDSTVPLVTGTYRTLLGEPADSRD